MAAMMMADFIVSAFDPTEVAIALATSLAPIPQAINNPKTAASINKSVAYSMGEYV